MLLIITQINFMIAQFPNLEADIMQSGTRTYCRNLICLMLSVMRVIEFEEFVRSLNIFHPNAPEAVKISCTANFHETPLFCSILDVCFRNLEAYWS